LQALANSRECLRSERVDRSSRLATPKALASTRRAYQWACPMLLARDGINIKRAVVLSKEMPADEPDASPSGHSTEITSTITSVSHDPINDSEFTVPGDFKETKLPDILTNRIRLRPFRRIRKESGSRPARIFENSKKVLTLFPAAEYKSAGTQN
jgi:hypothetical protein